MNSSAQPPKIPLWVFFLTDFALLAAAAFIAAYSPRPLATGAILGIVACVIAGAGVALIPLVLRFERQKNEALDDRQRALESLATTVSSSAEQIGIATAGLQQIAEAVQKNLRHAEQLPHRLQEKVAELQAQLANVNDVEKEELERELAALRGTETERLESISDRLTKAAADFAKLESTTHQHLTAATEAVGKLALGTASAIGKAQAAAEQALSHARVEAARHVGEVAGQNLKSLETAKAAALADFEAKLAATAQAIGEKLVRELAGKLAATPPLGEKLPRLENATPHPPVPAPEPSSTAAPHPAVPVPAAPAPVEPSPSAPAAVVPDESAPSNARRTRRTRREEPAAEPTAVTPAAIAEEPPPIPVDRIAEVTPIAPHTTQPFDGNAATHPDSGNGSSPATHASRGERRAKHDSGEKPAAASRKRAATAPEPAPAVSSLADDAPETSGIVERVLTSDGATRLIVTAYIGIGNRLFIRGQGPGLSWDKGVPLQFVSIGKWRWETNDATDPIQFKLLKNDEQECAALGAQTLDPGHQQELTAAF